MSQSTELRELARRLLRIADDLEAAETTRRYIQRQIDGEPVAVRAADVDQDCRAFDLAVQS